MKFLLLLVALLILFVAPVASAQIPDLEEVFIVDGGWRFAGHLGSDNAPDLIEVLADGEATIYFIDSSPLYFDTPQPVVRWIAGDPPWGDATDPRLNPWPPAVPVGNNYLTMWSGAARGFNIRGTGADSLYVALITAGKVTVSCSKER